MAHKIVGDTQEIPISSVFEGKFNLRQFYDEEKLDELGESISETGSLQPIRVRPSGKDKFELIWGSRRLRAAKKRKFSTIPATVVNGVSDREVVVMSLTENLQREDLTPFEEAWGFLKLTKEFAMSNRDVAKKVGCSGNLIMRRLKLLSLPKDIQELGKKKVLSLQHLEALVAVKSPEEQQRFAKIAVQGALSHEEFSGLLQEKFGKRVARAGSTLGHPIRLTGSKVSFKVKSFTKFLQDSMPKVVKMSKSATEEIRESLQVLRKEVNKAIEDLHD